jgi:RHS repeat-associated protein
MAGISSKAASSLGNRKKFNGMEYNNDFELNIGETFFRTHDPQTARWLQLDPKAEKYFCLSPYVNMANNPISITDPLGDDLELTGKKKNVDRAINNFNKILDGYYIASIDKNGKVQITATGKK